MPVTRPDFPTGSPTPSSSTSKCTIFLGSTPVVPQIAFSGQRGDLIHAGDFLSQAEDIFGSRKEFQSKDFLCSLTPWGAPLCCADQKVGALGRIPYTYACVYKITSLSRREPPHNHVCQKKDSLEPSSFDQLGTKQAFQEKKQTPLGTINVFLYYPMALLTCYSRF